MMMQKKFFSRAQLLFCAALMAAVLVFPGCDNPANEPGTSATKSSGKNITGFSINGTAGLIDPDAKTITVAIPYAAGLNPAALTPSITLSDKAVITPAPDTVADFSKPVVYTVTAEDGDAAEYTVTVWALFDYAADGISLLSSYLERAPADYNKKENPYYIALTGFDLSVEASGLKSFSEALHSQYVHLDLSRCTGERIPTAYYAKPTGGGHSAQTSYIEFAVSVILPNNLKHLGNYIFGNTKALSRVALPPTLETIGAYAFSQATAIKTLDFPSSLKTIDTFAFFQSSIETVVLPEGFTTLSDSVFSGSKQLKYVSLPSTLTGILEHSIFSSCNSLETVVIPANTNITGLGKNLFYSCSKLKTVYIPPTVAGVLEGVFNGCTSLTSLDLSQTKVTELALSPFNGCSSLETLALPATLTQIGVDNQVEVYRPLWGCVKLSTLVLYAAIPPTLAQYSGADALSDTAENLVIYVPHTSVYAYKTDSSWSAYADRIKSLNEMPQ
jgi:hypothetical protein